MIRVAFVTPTLAFGGAQMMLCKLLGQLDRKEFAPEVFSLTNMVPLADRLQGMDIPLHSLGMKIGVPDPRGLLLLAKCLRQSRPDVVLTWMYHADLLGGIASLLAHRPPVIWNIRHSNLNPKTDKRSTLLTAKACARLSPHLPEKIVCCAKTAQDIHVSFGYQTTKFHIIPNGFNLKSFRPDAGIRNRMREELGFGREDFVIGLVARFHPQKNHSGFVKAAGILARSNSSARFVLCGDDVTWENRELSNWIKETGNMGKFSLLGRRSDIPSLTTCFDIACSSSVCGEAFSNTLGEAMACAVPCVATNVGDAAEILGNTGLIVPPGDSGALAGAWKQMMDLDLQSRRKLGDEARQRVIDFFSLERVATQYEKLFRSVIERNRSGRSNHAKSADPCRLR